MPKGLVNLMTHAEFVDLVRFLSELGRPGPYAIRTTPTIQRWRVLKAVPPRLAEAVPDAETLRDQVLRRPARPLGDGLRQGLRLAAPGRGGRAAGGGQVLYLQGELDVTAGGHDPDLPGFPEAIRFWVDDVAAPIGTREFTASVTPGRHAVTVRVEIRRTDASRDPDDGRQASGLDGRVHGRRRQVTSALVPADWVGISFLSDFAS